MNKLALLLLGIVALPLTASAASYELLAPLGPLTGPITLNTYLEGIVKLFIGISGVIAVVMIVIYGVKLMGSPSVSQKSESKEGVTNAIIGLILAISSWIILNTINSDLLKSDVSIATISAVASPTLKTPNGSDVAPTAIGYYYLYYYDKVKFPGVLKNSPKFDTFQACDQVMKKAVAGGAEIARECYYVNPAVVVAAGSGEETRRDRLCGNTVLPHVSCINKKPVGVNNPPCATPGGVKGEHCTNLDGLSNDVIDFIKGLPVNPGESILITGGTEYNLHKSHAQGKAIFDLRLSIGSKLWTDVKNGGSPKASFCGNKKYHYNGYMFTDEINCTSVRHWHVCKVGETASVACTVN